MQIELIRARDGIDIIIFGDIETAGEYGTSAGDVLAELRTVDPQTPIRVLINSVGGSVVEGLAIYNLLRQHPGPVTTQVLGTAASIASIIMLAGDSREIAEDATVFVHAPRSVASGTAEQLEKDAELMRSVESQMTKIYVERTGQSEQTVRQWLTDEKTFTAAEAVEAGLATAILSPETVTAATARLETVMKSNNNHLQKQREQTAAEIERVAAIRAAAADIGDDRLDSEYAKQLGLATPTVAALEAKAVREGWDRDKFELEARRGQMVSPSHVAIHRTPVAPSSDVLKAALALHLGYQHVEKTYNPATLEAARAMRPRHILDIAEANLRAGGAYKSNYSPMELIMASGPSTSTFSTLLSDTANQELAQAYLALPSVARKISRSVPVPDFQKQSHIQLSPTNLRAEAVGADGELHSVVLGDRVYTVQADTYGKIVSVTRKDIINDRIGAFAQLPQALAVGALTSLERTFFERLLSNPSSFFAAANGNYLTGAGSALSVSGLNAAVAAMREQTNADGDPIYTQPAFVVVPPALEATAAQLFQSTEVVVGGGDTATSQQPTANPHRGKYEPLTAPYLAASIGLTGSSDTAWYLVSEPTVLNLAVICYVGGLETPILEDVSDRVPGDQLRMEWRTIFDYGVGLAEKPAGVLNTGT